MTLKDNSQQQAPRKTKPVLVLLPPPMLAELEVEAERRTISRSALVREACRELLRRHRQNPEA